ncbi:MAG TPA: hypothetical protein VFU15_16625 [Bacteroidia bacterium]|nr:hypothetical protein [Bacteroidia bacterium]
MSRAVTFAQFFSAALLLLSCGKTINAPPAIKSIVPAKVPGDYLLVCKNSMGETYLDQSLFSDTNDSLVYLHFAIRNTTADTIGTSFDASGKFGVYPNTWGFCDTGAPVICWDECVELLEPLTKAAILNLENQFAAGRLKNIPPGQMLDYYYCIDTKQDLMSQLGKSNLKTPRLRFTFGGRCMLTTRKITDDSFYGDSRKGATGFPMLNTNRPLSFRRLPGKAFIYTR